MAPCKLRWGCILHMQGRHSQLRVRCTRRRRQQVAALHGLLLFTHAPSRLHNRTHMGGTKGTKRADGARPPRAPQPRGMHMRLILFRSRCVRNCDRALAWLWPLHHTHLRVGTTLHSTWDGPTAQPSRTRALRSPVVGAPSWAFLRRGVKPGGVKRSRLFPHSAACLVSAIKMIRTRLPRAGRPMQECLCMVCQPTSRCVHTNKPVQVRSAGRVPWSFALDATARESVRVAFLAPFLPLCATKAAGVA